MASSSKTRSHDEILLSFLEINYLVALFDQNVQKMKEECGQLQGSKSKSSAEPEVEDLMAKVEALKKDQEELMNRSRDTLTRICPSSYNIEVFLQLVRDLCESLSSKEEKELQDLAGGIKGFVSEGEEINERANKLVAEFEERVKISIKEADKEKEVDDAPKETEIPSVDEDDGYQKIAKSDLELLKDPLPILEKLEGDLRPLDWAPVTDNKDKYESLRLQLTKKFDEKESNNDETQTGEGGHRDEYHVLQLARRWVINLERNLYFLVINLASVTVSCEEGRKGLKELLHGLRALVEDKKGLQWLPFVVPKVITLLEVPQFALEAEKGNSSTTSVEDSVKQIIYNESFRGSATKLFDMILTLAFVLHATRMPNAEKALDKYVLAAFGRTLKAIEQDLKELENAIVAAKTDLIELKKILKD